MNQPLNLLEYEECAQAVLPRMVYDYFASGAGAQVTVRSNRSDFDRIRLRPRALVGVDNRDHSVTIFGQKIPSPIAVAPMAFQKMAHPEGEIAAVRGTGSAGALFVASTIATVSLEEIAAGAVGPIWFQLYVFKDRELTRSLVQRAEAVGYTALQVTGDVPVMGLRESDMRNHFQVPPEFTIKNVEQTGVGSLPPGDAAIGQAHYTRCQFDAGLSWKDIEWLCGLTKLPVLVKGILRGDDAVRAIDCGCKGVVVSNHGGRQLDGAISTVTALPEVVEALAGRGEVVIDSGIRRGTDVLKCLALGAKIAQVGRPVIWGLALDGEAGARRVISTLRDEFDNALALCGCRTVTAIDRDLVQNA